MKSAAAKTTPSSHGKTPVGAAIGMDFLDTTWRMVVPVLIFTVLGIVADRHFGTSPWITLPAVVIGFVFAGILIKKQLAKVMREDQ